MTEADHWIAFRACPSGQQPPVDDHFGDLFEEQFFVHRIADGFQFNFTILVSLAIDVVHVRRLRRMGSAARRLLIARYNDEKDICFYLVGLHTAKKRPDRIIGESFAIRIGLLTSV